MGGLIALLAGLLFGAGLALSGMTDTAKVIGFLDITGTWNPSLALVMAGALLVTLPTFRLVLRAQQPLCDSRFHTPGNSRIDPPLLLGAALFGAGWGLVGYCPGPAIAALGYGDLEVVLFVVALLLGGWLGGRLEGRWRQYRDGPSSLQTP